VSDVFPGGKGGRCVRLITLSPSCTDFLESRSLNLLEPSASVQACNGIALPLSSHLQGLHGTLIQKTAVYIFTQSGPQVSYPSIIDLKPSANYEGWNFNSGSYLFTTDTK